jgi:hypothetical protein
MESSTQTYTYILQYLPPCLADLTEIYLMPTQMTIQEIAKSGYAELYGKITTDFASAVYAACETENEQLVKQFISLGVITGAIIFACANDNVNVAVKLINLGMTDYEFILDQACDHSSAKIAGLAFKYGARGREYLVHNACRNNDVAILAVLFNNGFTTCEWCGLHSHYHIPFNTTKQNI